MCMYRHTYIIYFFLNKMHTSVFVLCGHASRKRDAGFVNELIHQQHVTPLAGFIGFHGHTHLTGIVVTVQVRHHRPLFIHACFMQAYFKLSDLQELL